jgi:hypothetical protein
MRFVAFIASALGALVLTSAAVDAQAQTARVRAPALNLNEAAQSSETASPQRRALRWNENGRWGLNFNLTPPVGRETDWSDVEAGAYYRLNPRLHVGAAAGLGAPEPDPSRPEESDRRGQPRVRLETIFKF